MSPNSSRLEKIFLLNRFFIDRYEERNFQFTSSDVPFLGNQTDLVKVLNDYCSYTEFHVMKISEDGSDHFIICKR